MMQLLLFYSNLKKLPNCCVFFPPLIETTSCFPFLCLTEYNSLLSTGWANNLNWKGLEFLQILFPKLKKFGRRGRVQIQ